MEVELEPGFEWDPQKEARNIAKHGLSFEEAQKAFLDPGRLIRRDLEHSAAEERFYCFGRIEDAVATVRFTWRYEKIRIIGAGYWREGRKFYEEANPI